VAGGGEGQPPARPPWEPRKSSRMGEEEGQCSTTGLGKERRNGVREKGEGGLPFIEPSSVHVSQLQQVADATVMTLGGVF
jgi:hypothetical protein